jgi:hypothetical protein
MCGGTLQTLHKWRDPEGRRNTSGTLLVGGSKANSSASIEFTGIPVISEYVRNCKLDGTRDSRTTITAAGEFEGNDPGTPVDGPESPGRSSYDLLEWVGNRGPKSWGPTEGTRVPPSS